MADPTIRARLILDTSGYKKGVQEAQRSTGSFTRIRDTMAGVFGGNLVTAAAAKTKDFFVGAVKGAMAAEDANIRFKTSLQNIVGANDKQVESAQKFLGTMSKMAAVGKGELRPAFETLLRGTHSLTGAQDALKVALDVSAGTGKPLAAVSQALTRGFNGSTGGLGRLGIATKDASGHALSMTQIMANLNKTFGGQAAKQADTASGRMKNAQLQFKAFQVTVGQALMPVLAQLIQLFTQFMPVLQSVTSWVKANPALFKVLAITILAIVVAVKAWKIATTVWAAAQGIATAAMAVFNAVVAANPIVLIVIAIAALVAALILAYQHVGWFRAAVDAVWKVVKIAFNAIVTAGQWLLDFFKSHWQIIVAILTGPIGVAVLLIRKYWDQLKAAANAVGSFIRLIFNGVVAYFQAYIKVISVAINAIITVIKLPIAAAQSVLDGIKNAFSAIAGFISGIVGGVKHAIGAVVGAIKDPIDAVIGAWNRLAFGIPSFTLPSFDTHIPGIGKIGGQTFGGLTIDFPDLPKLATGGLITSPGLAYLHAAEVVVPAPQAGRGGPIVHIENAHFTDPVDVDVLMQRVATYTRSRAV